MNKNKDKDKNRGQNRDQNRDQKRDQKRDQDAVKIVIIGGKLQGTEAAYLAREAGFYSVVIDKNDQVPARGICNEFHKADICKEDKQTIDLLTKADIILPAMENKVTIDFLEKFSKEHPVAVAFDFDSYRISSSKILSDKLFKENNIPAPAYYPNCSGPYIAKPSGESGSQGVESLSDRQSVEEFLKTLKEPDEWIIQEKIAGPSYSLEIIGVPGAYKTYQITEIHMDSGYDCNKVTSPCNLPIAKQEEFENMAFKLAEILGLRGIMDLEVIDDGKVEEGKVDDRKADDGQVANEKGLKLLEIDARLPSQTPATVYHSTGINLLVELCNLFTGKWPENLGHQPLRPSSERFASYEHILVEDGKLSFPGEHIVSKAGPMKLFNNSWGSDQVISNYTEGDYLGRSLGNSFNKSFSGIFMNSAESQQSLSDKRSDILSKLKEKL